MYLQLRHFFNFKKLKIKNCEGPPAHWLLGNLKELEKVANDRRAYQLLWDYAKQYGKIYRVYIPFSVIQHLDFHENLKIL